MTIVPNGACGTGAGACAASRGWRSCGLAFRGPPALLGYGCRPCRVNEIGARVIQVEVEAGIEVTGCRSLAGREGMKWDSS